MILNKEELAVLDVFRKNPHKSLSIRDVQKISKKASKPYVFNTLKKLETGNFVEKQIIGTSGSYKAQLSVQAVKYFSILDFEEYETSKIPKKAVERIIKNVKPKKIPFCLIVFGSYARGNATAKSDLDVVLLVGSDAEKKKLFPVMESVSLRELVDIHYDLFTTSEFIEMLLIGKTNVGKEIAYNHMIVYGNEIYYQLIEEAHKHGYFG